MVGLAELPADMTKRLEVTCSVFDILPLMRLTFFFISHIITFKVVGLVTCTDQSRGEYIVYL